MQYNIGVYVDDIILGGKTNNQIKSDLSKEFYIKDPEKLTYFLGVKVVQDEENTSIWIGQPPYTEKI